MNSKTIIVATGTLLLIATGCGSNRIVGNNLTQEGHWYGEMGITGSQNDIKIQAPSELTKLSIIGNMNKVYVDDHVPLGKIEIWGRDNTISIPERLIIRSNQIGRRTVINRRPAGGHWIPRRYTYEPDTTRSTNSQPATIGDAGDRSRATRDRQVPGEQHDASYYYSPSVTVEEQ